MTQDFKIQLTSIFSRLGKWHQVPENIAKDIWAPDINFLKLISMSPVVLAGKNNKKFDFWVIRQENEDDGLLALIYQSFKVKFSCEFHFENVPFDSHFCQLSFGMPLYSNKTIFFPPIKILGKDTKVTTLDDKDYVPIPNNHLPYDFALATKDFILDYNYGYWSPHTVLIIKANRSKIGTLIGGFFGPTAIFALLSMISYMIVPEMVINVSITLSSFDF